MFPAIYKTDTMRSGLCEAGTNVPLQIEHANRFEDILDDGFYL